MYRLTTLGGLSLTAADAAAGPVASGATQRRKLAVLALLAASPLGVSRDKLVALLWPEADESSARAVLSQTLYATRRALRRDDLFLDAAGAVRLNPGVLTSDLDDWRRAVDAGDLERAAALYGGPFLDGFHLSGVLDFERWMDAERARLHQRYVALLDTLAGRALADARLTDAVRWRRAAVAADPYSTPLATALVDTLTQAGDRSGALLAARTHETLLRAELDVAPHGMLAAAVARAERAAPSQTIVHQSAPAQPAQSALRTAPHPPAGDALPATPRPTFSRRGTVVATVLAAGVLVAAALGLRRERPADAAPAVPAASPALAAVAPRLVVIPFTADDSASVPMGADIAELLGATMDGIGPFVVSGHVVVERGRVRVTADLYDRAHMRTLLAHAQVEGARTDLFGLTDRLASALVAQRLGPREGALVRAASVTTTSSQALNDYFQAEAEYRALRFGAAMTDLRRAVAEDSTFALAYYRMATTADWLNLGTVQQRAIASAVRYAARLDPHHRALVLAYRAFAGHQARDAEQRYADILLAYPDDAEAQLMAAEIAFHFGPGMGRPFTEARSAYRRVLALDPGNIEACVHLARIAAAQRRLPLVDSLLTRIVAVNPATPELAEVRVESASLHGDTAGVRRILEAARGNVTALDNLGRALAQFADDYPAAAAAFRLSAAARPAVPDAPPTVTALPAALALAQGRVGAMDKDIRMGWRGDPDTWLVRGLAALAGAEGVGHAGGAASAGGAAGATGAAGGFPDGAAALADSLWAQPPTPVPSAYRFPGSLYNWPAGLAEIRAQLWVVAAVLDARSGRADRAARAVAWLASGHGDAAAAAAAGDAAGATAIDRRTAGLLRIVILLARGDSAAALRAFDTMPPSFAVGSAAEAWVHAGVLAAAGRDADADREYASVSDGYVVDEALVPWALLRRAALARRDGNGPRADSLFARGSRLLAAGDAGPGD